jgi:hypothetical protein
VVLQQVKAGRGRKSYCDPIRNLNCVSACNQSQVVPELKYLCFYEAVMRGLHIIKNGSAPKDWSNYNKRILELARGKPRPVTLNDIEGQSSLGCCIDVYDKHVFFLDDGGSGFVGLLVLKRQSL